MRQAGDLSVIIVNHDTREMLRECLASVYEDLSGTPGAVEVVVIDNASSDGSPEMVREVFPQAHLILNPDNVGYARGVNQGIGASVGRYVLLLNSDTQVRKGAIRSLIAAAAREARVGGVAPTLLNPDGTIQRSCWPWPWKDLLGNTLGLFRLGLFDDYRRWDYRRDRWVDWLTSAALLVPREVFRRVGMFDEAFFYGVDVEWAHRAARAGYRFLSISGAAVIHYGRGSRQGPAEWGFTGGTHVQDAFFRKHYGALGVVLFRMLLGVGALSRLLGWEVAHLVKPSQTTREQRRLFRRLVASALNPRL